MGGCQYIQYTIISTCDYGRVNAYIWYIQYIAVAHGKWFKRKETVSTRSNTKHKNEFSNRKCSKPMNK